MFVLEREASVLGGFLDHLPPAVAVDQQEPLEHFPFIDCPLAQTDCFLAVLVIGVVGTPVYELLTALYLIPLSPLSLL